MKKLLYLLTGLCLLAGLFAGCEKKPLDEDNPNGGGTTPGGTSTEKTGTISGVVTDKGLGGLVSMATVELLSTDKKTQTDDLGAFSFPDVASGTYRLRVSKQGYGTYTSEAITVKTGQTVYRAIVLKREQTDLQILDAEDKELTELYLENDNKGVFKLRNTGSSIVEWEIPKLEEEWFSFSKESGKLAPGVSEQIEVTIDVAKLSEGENEAVVYIGSTAGTIQLKVRVNIVALLKAEQDLFASMVYVEGGTFSMGATSEQDVYAGSNEKPVHRVTLDGFYIGKYEVTQAQWEAVMGTTIEQQNAKSDYPDYLYGVGDDYPMYYVSWDEAVAFCQKLSEMTGKTYRLPTEAEWEYAARGGQHADGTTYAGSNNIGDVAWYDKNSDYSTHPVGRKQPNGLGLYDMSGNVWEWCSDWYGDYSSSPSVNPQGPASGSSRVGRGGGCYGSAVGCRVSYRYRSSPDSRYDFLGFRVACSSK